MKLLYKPLGMLFGVLGGLAGSAIFKQVWKRMSGEEEAPTPTSREYGWREVLVAATIQGAIFGLTKAAIDRAGATAYRKATGVWPDD